jgi:hypothetical protein
MSYRTLQFACMFMIGLACTAQALGQAHSQPQGQTSGQGFGQGQEQASTDSFRFNQPIPVNIRKSNNAVLQAMLAGIDEDKITIITPQGRTLEFNNSTIRTVRSLDGTFFYNPAKDNTAEVIRKLNSMQPAGTGPGATGTGQAGRAGQTGTTAGSTVPFSITGGNSGTTGQPSNGHAQPGAGHGQGYTSPNSTPATSASAAHMAAHSQAASPMPATTAPYTTASSHSQAAAMPAMPSTSHSPSTMPSMSHTSAMPGMSHSSTIPGMSPSTSGMPGPGMQTMWEFECLNCHHKFTSPVEIKAGHKCVKCGVVWGQVQDQNGRVMSSSPAARVGGAVGGIGLIVAIIIGIVKKMQSS